MMIEQNKLPINHEKISRQIAKNFGRMRNGVLMDLPKRSPPSLSLVRRYLQQSLNFYLDLVQTRLLRSMPSLKQCAEVLWR